MVWIPSSGFRELRGVESHHPMRFFHTTPSSKAFLDNSSIDFAYMPQFELEEPTQPEIMRIPLLPNNYTSPRNGDIDQGVVEPVIRPEISTVSADSTHIDCPSAMSEVTDNHAVELDPYDLTSKVTAAASKMAGAPVSTLKEPGPVSQLWNGVLDDLLGSKKISHT